MVLRAINTFKTFRIPRVFFVLRASIILYAYVGWTFGIYSFKIPPVCPVAHSLASRALRQRLYSQPERMLLNPVIPDFFHV